MCPVCQTFVAWGTGRPGVVAVKRTSMEQETLVFDKENVEETYMPTLERLVEHVPRAIQTKAANRAQSLSARMLIAEYYFSDSRVVAASDSRPPPFPV